MAKNINHVDGVIWVSQKETIIENVKQLEQLTGSKFKGPYLNDALGAHIFMSNSTGMQVMTPAPGSSAEMARALTARLEEHGEGVFGVVYGVSDILAAKVRLEKLGYVPRDLILATGDEPWAAEVNKARAAIICQVMNTTFICAEVDYATGILLTEGSSPELKRFNNRLDHMAWVCFPDNFERNVKLLSEPGGTPLDGPHDMPLGGIRIAISWETGLEVICPIPGSDGVAAGGAAQLLKRGEGIYGVLFGVTDMNAALEKARSAGYTPSDLIRGGQDPRVPWAGKYKTLLESTILKLMNTDFMYCFAEYPKAR